MLVERLLKGMEIAIRGQAFDRSQFGTIGLNRQHNAGANRFAVEMDRTGAAHAMLAANMRAGQSKILTQKVRQQLAWLTSCLAARAINGKSHRDQFRHDICLNASSVRGGARDP